MGERGWVYPNPTLGYLNLNNNTGLDYGANGNHAKPVFVCTSVALLNS